MKGLDGKIFNLLTRNFIWSFVLLPTGRIEKF
jgi:hypothetical protein